MWSLDSNGFLYVNVIDHLNTTVSSRSNASLPSNSWIHVAQTFSTSNGNRLYLNGTLVTVSFSATGRSIGPYSMIGASPLNTESCITGLNRKGQFYGTIDDYQVFNCELPSVDIVRLANRF